MANENRNGTPQDGADPEEPVQYDDENDVLYVTLSQGKVVKTVRVDDLRLVDYDAAGSPVGVEFIGASDGVNLTLVPSAKRIQILLQEAGIDFPIFA